MSTDVLMPKLGFAMEEGQLVEWLVPNGGTAVEGEPLFLLESDKSTQEIESPATGTLKVIIEAMGDSHPVGTVLGVID